MRHCPIPRISRQMAATGAVWKWILLGTAVVLFLAYVIMPNRLENGHGRSRVSIVKSDQRSIATALETYYIDHQKYPAWGAGLSGINAFMGPDSAAYRAPTLRRWVRPGEELRLMQLTTPVSYLQYLPPDILATEKTNGQKPFLSYWTDPEDIGWILISTGPDGDYDVIPEEEYVPLITQPSLTLILRAYDPTNGTVSGGDVYRVKQ